MFCFVVVTCLYEFISPRFASVELDRRHNASEITQTRVKLANNKSHQNTRNLVLEKHKKRYENICWRCHSFSICIERLHSQNKSICVCGEKFYLRKFSTESKFIWRKLRHESRTLYFDDVKFWLNNYSGIPWVLRCPHSPALDCSLKNLVRVNKAFTKAMNDQWISHTIDQYGGKCFAIMTWLWSNGLRDYRILRRISRNA